MPETAQKLTSEHVTLTPSAQQKMAGLLSEVEGDEVKGVRVYIAGSGCSGMQFGMTFATKIEDNDSVMEGEGYSILIDDNALNYLKGVEIDFVDNGVSGASFVFNNLPTPSGGGGCGSCGSSSAKGGGCS